MTRSPVQHEAAVPVEEMLRSDIPVPSPFLGDATYLAPSGKRVRFLYRGRSYVLATDAGKLETYFTWDELRSLYKKDPACLYPGPVPVAYVGTGVHGSFAFADLAVVGEYLEAEPFDLARLGGAVVWVGNLIPEAIEVFSIGSTLLRFRAPSGQVRLGNLSHFCLLSREELAEVESLKHDPAYDWRPWWADRLSPSSLACKVAECGGPWQLGDRREIALVGEGTITLKELLESDEAIPAALVLGTPVYTMRGARGVLKGLIITPLAEEGDGAPRVVTSWQDARRQMARGAKVMALVSTDGGRARRHAPELVRIPLSYLLAPPEVGALTSAMTLKRSYDPKTKRTRVEVTCDGLSDEGYLADSDLAVLDGHLRAVEASKRRLVEWLKSRPKPC